MKRNNDCLNLIKRKRKRKRKRERERERERERANVIEIYNETMKRV